MLRKLLGACVGLAMMGMAGTASAVPITYEFSGSLGSPVGTTPAGTLFSGFFTYESTAPDQVAGGTIGRYDFIEYEVDIGPDTLIVQDLDAADRVEALNSANYVFFAASFNILGTVGGLSVDNINAQFNEFPNTVGNDFLPGPNLTLADFDAGTLFIGTPVGSTAHSINSLTAAPEPSTLALFATGLALLAFLGWRRRGSKWLKAA